MNIPDEFYCPINLTVMTRPRKLPCGHNFESNAILEWLAENPTCPLDRSVIHHNVPLRRNRMLQRKIVRFFDQHPELEKPPGLIRSSRIIDLLKDLRDKILFTDIFISPSSDFFWNPHISVPEY